MIHNLIELLKVSDFKDESYNIQVAKGLYKYDPSYKKISDQVERMGILKKRLKKQKDENL